MILLVITVLIIVEVVVNIWLYYFYKCDFEENEIFMDVNKETKRKICLESIGLDFTKLNLSPQMGTGHKEIGGIDETVVKINSEGFRSPEYSIEKSNNTYRIFIMGGSTSFGAGVLDNQTFSSYLQKIFEKDNLEVDVEVINTGWVGWWSLTETKLIKEKLLQQEPDLFIVLDGWNELMRQFLGEAEATPILWKERWKEICELGKAKGFDTIITLQPTAGSGNKILSEQEYISLFYNKNEKERLEPYPQYIEQLKELKNSCTVTADLRGLFDNISEPIYYDVIHTGPRGNEIIAEKFYSLSLPLVKKKVDSIDSEKGFQGVPQLEEVLITSNEIDNFFDESFNIAKKVVFAYKTPRIIPLVFPQ